MVAIVYAVTTSPVAASADAKEFSMRMAARLLHAKNSGVVEIEAAKKLGVAEVEAAGEKVEATEPAAPTAPTELSTVSAIEPAAIEPTIEPAAIAPCTGLLGHTCYPTNGRN